MIGELFPIEAPRRSGDGEITVSVMFSFALLLGVGLSRPSRHSSPHRSCRTGSPASRGGRSASTSASTRCRCQPPPACSSSLGGLRGASDRRLRGRRPARRDRRGGRLLPGEPAAGHARHDPLHGHAVLAGASQRPDVRALGERGAAVPRAGGRHRPPVQPDPLSRSSSCRSPASISAAARRVRTVTAEHLARHDSLTELPNRRWFLEAVGQALKNPALERRRAAAGRPQRLQGSQRHARPPPRRPGAPGSRAPAPGGIPKRGSRRAPRRRRVRRFHAGRRHDAAQAAVQRLQDALHRRSTSTRSASSSTPASGWPGTPITATTSTPCSSARTSRCTAPRPATTRS